MSRPLCVVAVLIIYCVHFVSSPSFHSASFHSTLSFVFPEHSLLCHPYLACTHPITRRASYYPPAPAHLPLPLAGARPRRPTPLSLLPLFRCLTHCAIAMPLAAGVTQPRAHHRAGMHAAAAGRRNTRRGGRAAAPRALPGARRRRPAGPEAARSSLLRLPVLRRAGRRPWPGRAPASSAPPGSWGP